MVMHVACYKGRNIEMVVKGKVMRKFYFWKYVCNLIPGSSYPFELDAFKL